MDIVDELKGFAHCCGASEAGNGAFRVASLSGPDSDTTEMNLRAVLRDGAATIVALRKRVEELEGALKPFASYLDTAAYDLDSNGDPLPDDQGMGWVYLTTGDFRRARSALRAKGGEHGE